MYQPHPHKTSTTLGTQDHKPRRSATWKLPGDNCTSSNTLACALAEAADMYRDYSSTLGCPSSPMTAGHVKLLQGQDQHYVNAMMMHSPGVLASA